MTTPLTLESIRQAPKALLHDHLDGGLRPATVLELAEVNGYDELPATDVDGLATFFRTAAHSGSLVRYLEPFAHTVGVMQTPEALYRVASECVDSDAGHSTRGSGTARPRGPCRCRTSGRRGERAWASRTAGTCSRAAPRWRAWLGACRASTWRSFSSGRP